MLSHLDIENFAVIKKLSIDLHPGLNIITGETGAGKSVIIEAVSMVLGARADTDYIRTGEDKAVITMVVDGADETFLSLLKRYDCPEELPIIIKREINSQSRSLCRINGSIVSLSQLSGFCKGIADIHGQYDNQSLLDPENHLGLLDLFAGNDVAELKEKTAGSYSEYAAYSTELMKLRKSLTEAKRERELLRLELADIKGARLIPGEDRNLEESIRLMNNSEQIFSALSSAHSSLFGDTGCAVDTLGQAMTALQSVENYSEDFKALTEEISDIFFRTDDLNGRLRRLKDSISFSPDELDQAIERLDAINAIKKKYGGSIESALLYAEEAERKLDSLENADQTMKDLEAKIQNARAACDKWAEKLTAKRKEAAEKLEASVNRELSELNFKNAVFSARFQQIPISENGWDQVEFLISANRGEALRPLAKVASGGELSRIMLALKRIIGDIDGIPTMIFDEIDAGISGATAGIVGEKLRSISKNHQIICITHLPQIASMGDHHYLIKKESDEISTQTTVIPLAEEQHIEELARLLSGTEITDAARAQAKEMAARAKSM